MNARSLVLITVLAACFGCEGSGPEGSYPAVEGSGRGDGGLGGSGPSSVASSDGGAPDDGVTALPKCVYDYFSDANQCGVCGQSSSCDAPTYKDTGKGTIISSCCGLEWQQVVVDVFPDEVYGYHWQEAKDYCEKLKLNGVGWRLPTMPELITLRAVYGMPPPSPEINVPGSTELTPNPDLVCWSSSPVVKDDLAAWAYNFSKSGVTSAFKDKDQLFARCVR